MIIWSASPSLNGSFSFPLINLKLLLKKSGFFPPKINDQFKRVYTTKLFWGFSRWRLSLPWPHLSPKHRWLFKTLALTFLLITSLTCLSGSVSDFISCYISISILCSGQVDLFNLEALGIFLKPHFYPCCPQAFFFSACCTPLSVHFHSKSLLLRKTSSLHWSFCFLSSVQFSSVAQSCPTLCNPVNCSTPGLPVYHQLPEFTQTHIHQLSDAIHPSHPLSSPSPPDHNPSQHQSLFQWVNSSHEVTEVLEFQL